MTSRGGESFATLPLRWPSTTLLLVLLVTVAAAWSWPAVRFEPDVSRLFPADHPHVRIAALLDERARPARSLWILLRAPDLEVRVPQVAAALRASPLVAAVATERDELLGAAGERWREAPLWFLSQEPLAQLAARLQPEGRQAAIASLKLDLADDPVAGAEVAARDPLGVRWILQDEAARFGFAPGSRLAILADGSGALLRLTGVTDAYDADRAAALMTHVEDVMRGLDHDVFGGYAVARGDQQRIRADFERSSWCSLLAVAAYLCWVMRGVRLPLLVQLPAMLSILWAVPFGSALFGPLPTVAVAATAVLCGLGVDFAIHYAARYREARLHAGHDEAVLCVQKATVPELTIDMATTAVTFLAVGGGELSGLRAFGLLLALGLACSVLVTLTVLPVLLRFAGHRADPERSWLGALADRWLARPAARPAAWGLLALAVLLAGFVASSAVPLSADPEVLRPADDPVAAARQRIEARLGFATVPVALLVPMDVEPTASAAGLAALQAAGVLRFWSGLDATDTRGGREAVAAFREAHAGFADATLQELARAGFEPAPFAPALHELQARLWADPPPVAPVVLDLEGTSWRVVTAWPVHRIDASGFAAFTADVRARLGERVQVHGGPSVAAALETILARDLHRACVLAFGLAVLMVTVWLRSLPAGLCALLPSAIGLVTTLAALRLLDVPLSLVSFVAVPFVLGIGVDEGVHMVGRFRHGARTTGAVGVGVVRTSLGTVLGFSSLLFATSPGLRELGAIVAGGSLVCMLACLFVQAPLLLAFAAGHQSRAQQNQ